MTMSASGTSTTNGIARIKALVIDDDKDILTILQNGLRRAEPPILVDAFDDPAKALDSFKQRMNYYQVIITDIRMPDMSGFQLVKEIRKLDQEVKVIFMTAFEINKKEFDTLLPNTKVDDFIAKPVSIKHLADLVIKQITVDGKA